MAVQIYKSLVCDGEGCTNAFHGPPTEVLSHDELRERASAKGWERFKQWCGPMSDLCPVCAPVHWARLRGL